MASGQTIRPASDVTPQSSEPLTPDWLNHEHIAELTHGQAQQLIESAGSADLAKHAIEIVDQQAADARSSEVESPPEAQTKLARRLGYTSYLDLVESSKQAGADGDRHWLVTAVAGGNWALWNDADLSVERQFESQQAALAAAGASASVRKPK
jgi:hypothetical protein